MADCTIIDSEYASVALRMEDVRVEEMQRIGHCLMGDPRQRPLVQHGIGIVVPRPCPGLFTRAARSAPPPSARRRRAAQRPDDAGPSRPTVGAARWPADRGTVRRRSSLRARRRALAAVTATRLVSTPAATSERVRAQCRHVPRSSRRRSLPLLPQLHDHRMQPGRGVSVPDAVKVPVPHRSPRQWCHR